MRAEHKTVSETLGNGIRIYLKGKEYLPHSGLSIRVSQLLGETVIVATEIRVDTDSVRAAAVHISVSQERKGGQLRAKRKDTKAPHQLV